MLAAFGLAACGGGGGKTATTTAPTMPAVIDPVVPEGPTEGEMAAATKAAGTKADAIGAEALVAVADDEGLGGTGAPTDQQVEGEYNLAIKYGETSITVEATDADDNVKFMQAMDFGDGRTMHTRTMDADEDGNVVQEIAIVYTDIDAPTATPFADVHTPDVREDGEDATEAMPDDALNIAAGNLDMVKASAFVAPGGTVGTTDLSFQHAVEDDENTMDVDETMAAARISGTFNGAMGTYVCAADSACTVTVNGMGAVSGVSNDDDWIFVPASGETVDVADMDYLHYGFWLQKTTDADGADTYDEVQTFAGSSVDASGSVAAVEGTAEYNGGAVGVYVKNVYNPDRTVASATSGHFKADASLTANFGGGDVPANKQNTLTGTIDNFVLQHGEENTWSVGLKGGIDTSDGTIENGEASGMKGDTGSLTGTFHGSVAPVDHDMDDATDDEAPTPSSVVGEFNANFSDGSAAGGFGARRK